MKVFIIGSGGREHALAWRLSQDAEVLCAPGNAGIAQTCQTADIVPNNRLAVVEKCRDFQPDFVLVGPEDPLISGMGNVLREHGFHVFGPNEGAARLEGSKAFAKDIMKRAQVPTAEYQTFSDPAAAKNYASSRFQAGMQVAVKASGAALGKGVTVCNTEQEAHEAISRALELHELGDAGKTIVIEDKLAGAEFSLLTLISGKDTRSLPVAQDYKRILDGDQGPNTGGMGSYSPVPFITDSLIAETEEKVVQPILRSLEDINEEYRGVLFSGIMMHEGTPHCLEYNVRMGDPETQTIMRLIDSGFADACLAVAKGEPIPPITLSKKAAVTVILASEGYPASSKTGRDIHTGNLPQDVVLFHSGTSNQDGQLQTSGGRVLGVSAIGDSISEARSTAYQAIDAISFEGMQYRKDIAAGL